MSMADLFEVVGGKSSGGLVVREGKDKNSEVIEGRLTTGSLVRSLDQVGGRVHYELVRGTGPASGWVSTVFQGKDLLVQVTEELSTQVTDEPTSEVTEEPTESSEDGKDEEQEFVEDLMEVMLTYGNRFGQQAEGDADNLAGLDNDVFQWQAAPTKKAEVARPESEVLQSLIMEMDDDNQAEETSEAQALLRDLNQEESERRQKDQELKNKIREEYNIGWKVTKIPDNEISASKLGVSPAPQGMCCLVLDEESGAVDLAATLEPAAAVNLEYLSCALQVRKEDGREPFFSLDPVDNSGSASMQKKRFEPEWLANTSIGEVMFQADYYLKELSMGEHEQPVVGMKSSFDFEESDRDKDWDAREWFVVRQADVLLSQDGALLPYIRMGVEAREQFEGSNGLEDAAITRPNHPLVKYAEVFTENFELIAERKSVVFNLREVAKASVLAKYLVESGKSLEESWFTMAARTEVPLPLEIPQLWNERYHSKLRVKNGAVVELEEGQLCPRMHGVYGGVQFGLDKFTVGARAASASVQFARVGARGPMPRVSAALSMATSVTGGLRTPAMRAAVSMRAGGVPRGVQFGLDKFTVGARAASASVQFARVGARGPMPRVSAALSMATSVTGGLRTPAMRAAVSMRAGGVPRGVQFGLDKFTVGARAASASVQFARVGARGPMPRVSAALSMATSVTGGLRTPAMRAAVSMRAGGVPRGVQFGLDKFTVGARAASASVQFARVGARGPMPRVSAALSMATSVTGGLRTPAMRAAVSMRAGGVPRGVDLNLDEFDLSELNRVDDFWVCSVDSAEARAPIGCAFWANLESGPEAVFTEEDSQLLRSIFHPKLTDRREEGELFVPPETTFAYVDKLRSLVKEEDVVRQRRCQLFFNKDFHAENPGQVFPFGWRDAFQVAKGRNSKKGQCLLVERPEYVEQQHMLQDAWKDVVPTFDKTTEDGTRFRIYRLGALDVRTTQAPGSEEAVGAVFAVARP